jgi:hypothetical protein
MSYKAEDVCKDCLQFAACHADFTIKQERKGKIMSDETISIGCLTEQKKKCSNCSISNTCSDAIRCDDTSDEKTTFVTLLTLQRQIDKLYVLWDKHRQTIQLLFDAQKLMGEAVREDLKELRNDVEELKADDCEDEGKMHDDVLKRAAAKAIADKDHGTCKNCRWLSRPSKVCYCPSTGDNADRVGSDDFYCQCFKETTENFQTEKYIKETQDQRFNNQNKLAEHGE